ncbi:MAG: hypothetical protein ACLT8E_03615 [Akkermansia sp.]
MGIATSIDALVAGVSIYLSSAQCGASPPSTPYFSPPPSSASPPSCARRQASS